MRRDRVEAAIKSLEKALMPKSLAEALISEGAIRDYKIKRAIDMLRLELDNHAAR